MLITRGGGGVGVLIFRRVRIFSKSLKTKDGGVGRFSNGSQLRVSTKNNVGQVLVNLP